MNPQHATRYTYYITAATYDRFPFFRRRDIAQTAYDTILGYRNERYDLHAAVVMPDHIHAVITPAPDQLLERCVQCIKGGISFRIRDYTNGAKLWQLDTHNSRIRDDADMLRVINYIRKNPAERGLTDWPFLYLADSSHD